VAPAPHAIPRLARAGISATRDPSRTARPVTPAHRDTAVAPALHAMPQWVRAGSSATRAAVRTARLVTAGPVGTTPAPVRIAIAPDPSGRLGTPAAPAAPPATKRPPTTTERRVRVATRRANRGRARRLAIPESQAANTAPRASRAPSATPAVAGGPATSARATETPRDPATDGTRIAELVAPLRAHYQACRVWACKWDET